MKDREKMDMDDLLDRATVALRGVAVPPGPPAKAVARALEAGLEGDVVPLSVKKRSRRFDRLAKIAVAASTLAAVGILVAWLVIGSSSNTAFAMMVANVLEHLQSAKFDMSVSMNDQAGQTNITMTAKGLFQAPSRQRIEGSGKADRFGDMVIVADYATAKGLVLMPRQKVAVVVDSEKIKDQIDNPMTCMFETMRSLVREGRNRSAMKIESIGKKEIGGKTVVGFLAHGSMCDMTLWADPQTARPVRIELDMPAMKAHGVLSNFQYDVKMDPSLFSLEVPTGYLTQAVDVGQPLEKGLIETLRAVAEHRGGMFPKRLGMNKEVLDSLQSLAKPDIDEIAVADDEQALDAIIGALPVEQNYLQGILFYMSLKPENDANYFGSGVKLGTPNRVIFTYKPSGSDRYRVIYADLSVKEASANEVTKLRPAKSP